MSYTKQTWVDGSAGGTPISAERLNHIEDGVSDAHDKLNWPTYDTLTDFQAAIAADEIADGTNVFITDPDS